MANRTFALKAGPLAAALTAGLVVALTLGSAAMVAANAASWRLQPADVAALRFTVLQAALSATVSAALAIPIARALARQRFPGRDVLIRLMAAPFLLPVLVAVLGLLAVFGRGGPVNLALTVLGVPPVSIFGLHGVVLAHIFLNLPLTTRMLLMGWQSIPAERLRLAASLGLRPRQIFRHLEAPMLRSVLPGATALVFLLCLTSFAVALTLGGGPRASTLELSIYQALRFDYDLGRAALLSALQFMLCAVAAIASIRLTATTGFGAGLDRRPALVPPSGLRRVGDMVAITLAALFLLLPVAAILLQGASGLASLPHSVWPAAGYSVLIALVSSALATAAALSLTLAATARSGAIEIVASLPLATSGLVLGTGLFLAVHPFVAPERLAVPVTILVNAALALPFVFRLLLPEARQLHADFHRLSLSLGLSPAARFFRITLPRLARPLGFGTGVAAALSMGDLGVIALFANSSNQTLPLLIQRLMGAYRMEAASGAALILVTLSFSLFLFFDWIGSRHAPT